MENTRSDVQNEIERTAKNIENYGKRLKTVCTNTKKVQRAFDGLYEEVKYLSLLKLMHLNDVRLVKLVIHNTSSCKKAYNVLIKSTDMTEHNAIAYLQQYHPNCIF